MELLVFHVPLNPVIKLIMFDGLVKTRIFGWLSKKLHMRGALKYVAMIVNLQQRSR